MSDEVHQLAGFDFARAVVRHASGNLHLVAIDCCQHDDSGFEFVFQLVHGVAQCFGVRAFEPRGQHLDTLDIDSLQHQLIALRRRQLALERGNFLFQRPDLIEHLADAVLQLGRTGLQRAGSALDCRFQRLQISQRVFSGDGFNAPHARCHAAFGHDLEQANIAGAAHVRTTAEFLARTNAQYAHLVAVLFAEQHHRA